MQFLFRYDSATVTLHWNDRTKGFVEELYSETPGQGNAKEVMNQLLGFADHRGLELWLKAKPFGARKGLSEAQLVDFYRKFEFEIVNPSVDPIVMRRNRKNNMTYNEKRDYVK